jgi:methionyl-tRNA formyltransferase
VTSLRVVFAGTPEVAVPTLKDLVASTHQVVGVLTRPDAPTGRGRRLQASPIAQVAEGLGLPLAKPVALSEPDIRAQLAEWNPDVIVVVAYGLLIPRSLLDLPRLGWINAHFSALPRWRGAAPVQYAIAQGDTTTCVTTFRIEEGLDTGPILSQSPPVTIADHEDAGQLLTRLSLIAADTVLDTLDALAAGTANAASQSTDDVTYAPRITTQDARVDWDKPVEVVDRWIRACSPTPGAWSMVKGDRIGLGSATEAIPDVSAVPGSITAEKKRVLVGAQGGYLVLGWVQPMGKKQMPAADWARGYRDALPTKFDMAGEFDS